MSLNTKHKPIEYRGSQLGADTQATEEKKQACIGRLPSKYNVCSSKGIAMRLET